MTYKISELAKIAGISTRTLRFYDEVGLLSPQRKHESNYRLYDDKDVDKLQHILILRAMGLSIKEMKKLLKAYDDEQRLKLFKRHLIELKQQKKQLELIIKNVTSTIQSMKGAITMSDQAKFEGLKEALIRNNDANYRDEVIERFGKDVYEKATNHFKHLTQEQYHTFMKLSDEIIELLKAIKIDPADESLKEKVAMTHQRWLTIAWGSYNKEAHRNLAKMYVEDERFIAFYDAHGKGLTHILKDAIESYIK